ncbi:MAG: glycosyltransferase [Tannerellaceae bacterium]|jgi:hypothetical protein|nr:glycosyltransferase [Tannerellaceae bacterium]
MGKAIRVTVLLPAVNETYSLRQTAAIIRATCRREELEEFLIVLCAKTTKACAEAAAAVVAESEGIRVRIYYQREPFVGNAIREAFELAGGTHVVVMSTDLETDPRLVSEFIRRVKLAPERIVTASRWIGEGSFKGYNVVKLVCNYLFQKLLSGLYGSKLTDMTYGYRIFPVELVQSIRWEETKHPFFLETALKPLRLGVEIDEIPAKWESRTEGESQNTFFKNFVYVRIALRVRLMKESELLKA